MPVDRAPRRFPNPDLAPRVVLYPISGAGVALEWRLDPALVEQARNAFALHQPVTKLYLQRADADGAVLAETALTDLLSNPTGQARFQGPLVGRLQAEIGLEGRQGSGWLLLARSNRLDLVPEPEPAPAPEPEPEPAPEPEIGPDHGLKAQRPARNLKELDPAASDRSKHKDAVPIPQAPSKQPVLMQGPGIASATAPAGQSLAPATETALAQGPVQASRSSGATRFPDPSLAALAIRPELRVAAFPLPQVPSLGSVSAQRAVGSRLNAPAGQRGSASAPASPPEQGREQRPSQHGSEDQAAADQVLLDHQPPNRQDIAPSEWLAKGLTLSGSGPLAPYPSGEHAVIQGELHVFGSAAPGSLLDLGGHSYQVGPGGRFSFRVALDDPDLLAALLQRLPELPVSERDP